MGPAFESSRGPLASRLLAALVAAESAGGDVRGQQSAAIVVVSGDRPKNVWEGRLVDLHVEHDERSLEELRRLLRIQRAHDCFTGAQQHFGTGDFEAALELLEEARRLKPDEVEFAFWTGVAFANAGRRGEARRWLEEAYADDDSWRELARRLATIGLFAGGPELIEP
jgi:tetratricopeptide (TPR) repeat protein